MVINLPFTFYSNYVLVLKSYLCPYVYLVFLTRSCPTLCEPKDCSPQGSSVHGILQARILEWVVIPFSRGSSEPWDPIWVSWIAGRFFTIKATREILISIWDSDICDVALNFIVPMFMVQFSSIQSLSLVWLFEIPRTGFPCPSPTPGACSNSCPSSRWCHPTMSSSVVPFSSCPQSFPASGSFQMSQFFTSGGQSMGVPALASVCPVNIQDWFPLGLTNLISLLSEELSKVFSNTTVQKHQFFGAQLSLWSSSHIHIRPLEKTIALTRWTFVGKVMSLLFNMPTRLFIAFLPRSKHLFISWLQSSTAVILEPKKIKPVTVSVVSPSICHEVCSHEVCRSGSNS